MRKKDQKDELPVGMPMKIEIDWVLRLPDRVLVSSFAQSRGNDTEHVSIDAEEIREHYRSLKAQGHRYLPARNSNDEEVGA